MESSNDNNSNFIDRLKESPRTVSALIVILIVAAAIYAFSGDQSPSQTDTDIPIIENTPVPTDRASNDAREATEGSELADATVQVNDTPISTPALQTKEAPAPLVAREPLTRESLRELADRLPSAERNEQGFIETTGAGEGITHLARRASTRWLVENDPGYSLTNEHRIYIEDYIQKRIGAEMLEIGETRAVSFDLISEAVAAAGELNENQLQNLTQYTYALSAT
jgi:hypothetical protein